ncbi:MAG: DUF2079 domain-containing protein [Deltaproteobacteria bacterium]|nr:DUF2079 domain-containing protein [Deltaproteobacteria bacterium]
MIKIRTSWVLQTKFRAALLIGFIGFAFYGFKSLSRFFLFGMGIDLAIFHQSIWLLSRFKSPLNTVRNIHAFGDHAEYIDILISPLLWIWSGPETLLILQAIAIAMAAAGLVYLASSITKRIDIGIAFSFIFIFAWETQLAGLNTFHTYTLAVAPIVWLTWSLINKRVICSIILTFMLLIIREDMSFVVIALGMGFCWNSYTRRSGIILSAIGIVYAIIVFTVLFPIFRQQGYFYWSHFIHVTTMNENTTNILMLSISFVQMLFDGGLKIRSWVVLLLDASPAVFFSPLSISILPSQFARVLSERGAISWGFHYGIIPLITALCGAADGIGWIQNKTKKRNKHIVSIIIWGTFVISLSLSIWPPWGQKAPLWSGQGWLKAGRIRIQDAIELIPKDASVASNHRIIDHLAGRDKVYMLGNWCKANYVIIDKNSDPWPNTTNELQKLIAHLSVEKNTNIVHSQKTITVFLRKHIAEHEFICPILKSIW